jgi:hypothetical protein
MSCIPVIAVDIARHMIKFFLQEITETTKTAKPRALFLS